MSKVAWRTSKAKGAVVYLIFNSRLSETCFNLLMKQMFLKIIKKKKTKIHQLVSGEACSYLYLVKGCGAATRGRRTTYQY